jgi:hypothetical protein
MGGLNGQLSKNGTGNYPKCGASVTIVTRATAGPGKAADRALFLFFFQRLVTGAAMAGGDINIRIETGDHNVAERTMGLSFHGRPRRRAIFAALWPLNAQRRDFRHRFAFSHEVETDLLFAA